MVQKRRKGFEVFGPNFFHFQAFFQFQESPASRFPHQLPTLWPFFVTLNDSFSVNKPNCRRNVCHVAGNEQGVAVGNGQPCLLTSSEERIGKGTLKSGPPLRRLMQ